MTTELLPCPFCGGTPKTVEIGNDASRKRSVTVKCLSCNAQRTDAGLRASMAVLRKWAVEQWNQRIEDCRLAEQANKGEKDAG